MKAPLFHVGQAVVCLTDIGWVVPPSGAPLPKANCIYIVSEMIYDKSWDVKWWQFWRKNYFLALKEIPNYYFRAECFAPVELASDEALSQLLEESLAPLVTADII